MSGVPWGQYPRAYKAIHDKIAEVLEKLDKPADPQVVEFAADAVLQVIQSDPSLLKATVTQAEKDRTVTGIVSAKGDQDQTLKQRSGTKELLVQLTHEGTEYQAGGGGGGGLVQAQIRNAEDTEWINEPFTRKVEQAEKDRTVSGAVGLKDADEAAINPAEAENFTHDEGTKRATRAVLQGKGLDGILHDLYCGQGLSCAYPMYTLDSKIYGYYSSGYWRAIAVDDEGVVKITAPGFINIKHKDRDYAYQKIANEKTVNPGATVYSSAISFDGRACSKYAIYVQTNKDCSITVEGTPRGAMPYYPFKDFSGISVNNELKAFEVSVPAHWVRVAITNNAAEAAEVTVEVRGII